MMPGRTLHRLAAHICSPNTLTRIVEPAIADLQKEYGEAGAADRVQRVCTLLTGYAVIVKVIAMCALSLSIATDEERRAIIRTMAWSFTLMLVVTALLMLPPLSIAKDRVLSSIFLVIPQAVPLAIPIGLTFGIAFGLAGHSATRGTKKIVLLTALLASLVSFVTLAWVMPAGNQAYRESLAQADDVTGQPMKGPNEMTFSELDREAALAVGAGNIRSAARYVWSFHLRVALSAASVVLAGFLFATAFRGVATRGLTALIACFAYWALIYVGEGLAVYSPIAPVLAGTIPVFAGAWLPNIVFAVSTMLIVSWRSSRLRGPLSSAG
jgi:hypothetical protein